MKLYPKIYLKDVTRITLEVIRKYKIEGFILDVDNTLIDFDKKILNGALEWVAEVKKQGIKLVILSNSNKKEKVERVANKLDIPYLFFAKKPLKLGFKKAQKILGIPPEHIATVGDQIFTDVIGANRCKMIPILVEPISKKDIWVTKLKRPIEEFIIKRYLEKVKGEKESVY